jgi:polysaccharide export outer membrane protein
VSVVRPHDRRVLPGRSERARHGRGRGGTTLLQGLSLGGGFTNFAATRRIQLRRTHPHTGETSMVTLDYRALSDGGMLRNDPVLADGDVILVPERRLFE